MKVTNNSKALQGVQTRHGVAYLRPGETKELELTKVQAERATRLTFLKVKGEPVKDPAPVLGSPEVVGAKEDLHELNAMRAALEELRAENTDLRNQLEGISNAKDGPKGPFEVKETSPGWYAAFDVEGKQVGNKMRSDDAEAFKVLSDEDQAKYLSD